jgi:hypothetical protein
VVGDWHCQWQWQWQWQWQFGHPIRPGGLAAPRGEEWEIYPVTAARWGEAWGARSRGEYRGRGIGLGRGVPADHVVEAESGGRHGKAR